MFFKDAKGICSLPGHDFMWVAEYNDGTFLPEFDANSRKENIFYSINKTKLLKFGLIGCGYKFYYDTIDGSFYLDGRKIEIEYRVKDKVYNLTGNDKLYNDIIQFKEAESNFNPLSRNSGVNTGIVQYNFGYKIKLQFEDVNFNFKAICKIPYEKPIYIEINLTSDKNMNGQLIFKRNGMILDSFDAPLTANKTGMLNWDVI